MKTLKFIVFLEIIAVAVCLMFYGTLYAVGERIALEQMATEATIISAIVFVAALLSIYVLVPFAEWFLD